MAMMGSSAAWNGQESQMHSGPDDDLVQQFLDMNGMGGLGEGLQFDFQGFEDFSGGGHGPAMMQHQQHQPQSSRGGGGGGGGESMDTAMSGTDMPGLMSNPMTTAPPHAPIGSMAAVPSMSSMSSMPSMPSAMVSHAAHTAHAPQAPPTPSDAISEIDAKIQFLQQQRLQQQQRQLEEQQAAFYAQQQSRMVPPTPQSLDIQAGNQFYVQPDQTPQQGIYDRYSRMNEQQDMAFTPLVSPAVTPLETQFPMDSQFTIPGAYFSPLASPALHAQTDGSSVFDKAATAATSSPTGDMGLGTNATQQQQKQPSTVATTVAEVIKKARKGGNTGSAKTRGKGNNVRQSPITKPQRKKTATTPIINSQALHELAESLEQSNTPVSHNHQAQLLPPPAPHPHGQHAQHAQHAQGHGQVGSGSSTVGATDSENGSVSPETLSDMPPPPIPSKPRSARPSPYMEPQNAAKSALGSGSKMSPATPASLMRLTSPNTGASQARGQEAVPQEHIENFELPESVNFHVDQGRRQHHQHHQQTEQQTEQQRQRQTQRQTQRQAGPAPSPLIMRSPLHSPALEPGGKAGGSGSGGAFQALPSPGVGGFAKPTAPASASQSPLLTGQGAGGSAAATPTPAGSSTPTLAATRKTPQLAPRGSSSKKRASVSSVHVSPALRPRISPNIKPLLPGTGGMGGSGSSAAEDAASRLLASKSNYQNILEGNSVPGVSYPPDLSTNLTSKRTSHKIAEQGRRNRINSALQEIATLLPGSAVAAIAAEEKRDGGSDGGGGGAGDKGGKGGGGGGDRHGATPSSKASTVEMAIEYIKTLKREVEEANRRAEEAERKLRDREGESAGAGAGSEEEARSSPPTSAAAS